MNQLAVSFSLSWRLLKQEFKRGELTIMLLALVLSVSSVFALAMFSERLQMALQVKSAEFLAADRVLESSREIDPSWLDQAQQLELNTSEQIRFSSMLFANDYMQLTAIRAVDEYYPLRGKVMLTDAAWTTGQETDLNVQAGEIWLDSKSVSQLKVKLGDWIEIGATKLKFSQIIDTVPDADLNVFNASAMAIMHIDDVAATQVIQPASRIGYLLSFSGEFDQLTEYEDYLMPLLNRDIHRWRSTESDESAMLRAVERAEQYFLLASLLGIVLAATAIAVAASRFCERHFDLVAIIKTLGGSTKQIKWIFNSQLVSLMVIGIVLGLSIGYVGQIVIMQLLAEYLPEQIPQVGMRPWWLAVLTGSISLALFSVYPLLKLFAIPPLRVLRRDIEGFQAKDWLNWLVSALAIFLLMWIYSQNIKLSLALLLSAGGITLVLLLLARSTIWTSRKAGANAGSAFKLAVAGLYRRATSNSVQLISFTLAIELLLIVLVLRNDLLAQWQSQLPEQTPNHFVINVNDFDIQNFKADFAEKGIQIEQTYPVTRGRLIAINGEFVRDRVSKEEEKVADEDAPRSIGRELNLTAGADLPDENEIVQGTWFSELPAEQQAQNHVSVEQRLAERMKLNLGDELTFNVGGIEFTAIISSLRTVKWESMKPNFFMIFNPQTMQDFAATHIASFYVPSDKKPELSGLLMNYPSVSLIDVDAIIQQIREIIQQVSLAVEFILILVVCAGILVFVAQTQASMFERKQELVILRTLGASSQFLRASVLIEFVVLGALAGLFAALANEVALYILQTEVFKMQASFHLEYWLVGIITGAVLVGCLGLMSCWRMMQINTQALLRSLS